MNTRRALLVSGPVSHPNEPQEPMAGTAAHTSTNPACAIGTSRLKGCERWHPGIPSELHLRMVKSGLGIISPARRCLACQRHRSRLRAAGKPMPPRLIRLEGAAVLPKKDYGVLPPLSWAPPQL